METELLLITDIVSLIVLDDEGLNYVLENIVALVYLVSSLDSQVLHRQEKREQIFLPKLFLVGEFATSILIEEKVTI